MNELLPYHPEVLVPLVEALIEDLPLIALIRNEAQRRELLTTLCDWGLPAERIHSLRSFAVGLWVRDYGPAFIRENGRVLILDPEYWYPNRPEDDQFPTDFAELLRLDVRRVPLKIEGGNILSNGHGLGLCSTALLERNADRYAPQECLELLGKFYGFRQVIAVRPLLGGKTAHIDMFATFTSPDTLVLGQYSYGHDPANACMLDDTQRELMGCDTGAGPLKIQRIPMPPHDDGIWRTYTNLLYANQVLAVPRYEGVDSGLEREALKVLGQLLPERRFLAIECTSLVKTGGALRCVSLNIPELGRPIGVERPLKESQTHPPRESIKTSAPTPIWGGSIPPGAWR